MRCDDVYDDEADDGEEAYDLLYDLCGLEPGADRYPDHVPPELEPGIKALLLDFCLENGCSEAMAIHALEYRYRNRVLYRALEALGYVDRAEREQERLRQAHARRAPAPPPPPVGLFARLCHALTG